MKLLRPGDEESYLVADGCLSTETKRSQDKTDNKHTVLKGQGDRDNTEDSSGNTSPRCIVEAYPATKTYFPSF